jgi:AcrR family transcriptional regulator
MVWFDERPRSLAAVETDGRRSPARARWLDEGLAVLADVGAPGLRVERLAARLGVTKGSFYHHFESTAAYRRALLEHHAERHTLRFIDEVEAVRSAGPRAQLRRLMELVESGSDDRIEIAVRAWAAQDDDAYDAQRRIDAMRVDYVFDLCAAIVPDRQRARDLARAQYLLLIGAEHVVPPLGAAELRRLWDLMMEAAAPTSSSA